MQDDTVARIKYDILLKQFEMLRNEAHQRLGYYLQIYQIYVLVLTAVYGYIISNKHWDIFLLFPWISMALYMRLVWDQKVLFYISDYTKLHIAPWFNEAMTSKLSPNASMPVNWITWDDYYPAAFSEFPKYYKHSIVLIFGVISIVPSIGYCLYNLTAPAIGVAPLTEFHPSNDLFISLMGIFLFAFIIAFGWIVMMTYSHDF